MAIKETKVPILNRKKVADHTYEIQMGRPAGFDYKPGQYITVRVDAKVTDAKGPSRAFSIASSPSNQKYISTCFRFRDEPSEFKDIIMNSPLGTEVFVRGPLGTFTLQETNKPIVFIAGGVGITPFMSMIRYLTETNNPQKIALIYTNKNQKRTAYLNTLKTLSEKTASSHFTVNLKGLIQPVSKNTQT